MRWGIVATGNIANKFASAMRGMKDPEIILAACASRTREAGETFAAKYEIPLVFDSYEAMAASDAVDAVYICTPNNLHAENTRMFLEHGKHVLCEKPFTTCASDAVSLYALAKERGLFLMEALWTYHLPLIHTLRDLIGSGVIGRPMACRSDFGYIPPADRRERKFRSDLAGGALLDIGIYNLAFSSQMLGAGLGDFTSQVTMSEYGTDAYSMIIGDYDGARASMNIACGTKYVKEGMVYGELGRIWFPNFQEAEKAVVTLNDGTEMVYEAGFDVNGFEYEIREADRCIKAGLTESPDYTHDESIQRMRELDRIRAQWGMKFSYE